MGILLAGIFHFICIHKVREGSRSTAVQTKSAAFIQVALDMQVLKFGEFTLKVCAIMVGVH